VISIEDMTMFGQHRPKPDARMFRHVLARLKLRACDCVLVEDTLEHQKAAHALGMRAVWMQRYLNGRFRGTLRDGINDGRRTPEVGVHPCHSPRYVYARIKSLQTLRALR
jgi:putative hydrolase of the HAD superfamily